jgi:hypothetical protein
MWNFTNDSLFRVGNAADGDNLNGVIGAVAFTAKNNHAGQIGILERDFVLGIIILADSDVQKPIESVGIGRALDGEIVASEKEIA